MQQLPTDAGVPSVIVVLYRSADVIAACLQSLLGQADAVGQIVLVDNASPDDSVSVVTDLLTYGNVPYLEMQAGDTTPECTPRARVVILRNGGNRGFAAGVNAGLRYLLSCEDINLFWILNPDCVAEPETAVKLRAEAVALEQRGGFALLGTRILYRDGSDRIQSDGGVWSRWSGRCKNLNQGSTPDVVDDAPGRTPDFISGASMVASRRFVEDAGLMPETYFLYYEEVDWAARRRDLPLAVSRSARVLHHGGTAIGSGAPGRVASPMASYFNFRNRVWFMRRYHPKRMLTCHVFSILKVAQLLARGAVPSALAALRGAWGLSPPACVRDAFAPEDHKWAFGEPPRRDRFFPPGVPTGSLTG